MNHVWLHVHPDEIDYRVDRVDSISIRLVPRSRSVQMPRSGSAGEGRAALWWRSAPLRGRSVVAPWSLRDRSVLLHGHAGSTQSPGGRRLGRLCPPAGHLQQLQQLRMGRPPCL